MPVVKKVVYNNFVGELREDFYRDTHTEVVNTLSAIPGVLVQKEIFNWSGLNIGIDSFYADNNIPVRLKIHGAKDIYYNTNMADYRVITYVWFSVRGIDYITTIFRLTRSSSPSSSEELYYFRIVDSSQLANAEMVNPDKLSYSYRSRNYAGSGNYLQNIRSFTITVGYTEDLGNFYFNLQDNLLNDLTSDMTGSNSFASPLGHSITKNGKFVTYPACRYTYEEGKFELNTSLVSAYSSYIGNYDDYRGDLYSTKMPIFEVDIFNSKKGKLDTFRDTYLINIPSVLNRTGEMINVNGDMYVRIWSQFIDGKQTSSSYSRDLYMKC